MLLIYISLILSNYVSFVDSCALAFVTALKRSALFAAFRTKLSPKTYVLGGNEAIRLSISSEWL